MIKYHIHHSGANWSCLLCDDDSVMHDFECPDNGYIVPEPLRQTLHDIREQSMRENCHRITISVTDENIYFINVETWFIDNLFKVQNDNNAWHAFGKDMLDGRYLNFYNFSFLWFAEDLPGSDETVIWLYEKYGYENLRFDNIVPHTVATGTSGRTRDRYMAQFWTEMSTKYRGRLS